MKAFLFLVIVIGLGVGGFFGYKHFIEKDKTPPKGGEVVEGENQNDQDDPKGRGPTTPTPPTSKPPSEADEIAKLYPMPEFKTLEELTNGWTTIPPQAFPRDVKLKESVKFTAGPTTLTANPGAVAKAVKMEGGMMELAFGGGVPASARVSPKVTDIVDQIEARYEEIKARRKKEVLAQREAELKRRKYTASLASTSNPGSSSPKTPVVTSTAPSKTPKDPRLAPMVKSIESGSSREIKMKNIHSWRWVGKTREGGQEYDSGLISYTVDTLFGPMDTEAMALIKNGRVVKWVYTGSGEEVP